MYMTAVERSSEFAEKIGIGQSGLSVAGSALISPLTDLTSYLALCGFDAKCEFGDARLVPIIDCIAPMFFTRLFDRGAELADLKTMAEEVDFPSVFINTSSDDFIHVESLKLATALVAAGRDVELHDWHTDKGQTLGHVFPVCMSWLDESQKVLRLMRDFAYAKL